MHDVERAYVSIINEFQEQRDQLLRRIHHAKQNIRRCARLEFVVRKIHLMFCLDRLMN